jgi:hypothetical protein
LPRLRLSALGLIDLFDFDQKNKGRSWYRDYRESKSKIGSEALDC